MAQIAVTAGILILLLICYFLSTWLLFKKAIGTAPDGGCFPYESRRRLDEAGRPFEDALVFPTNRTYNRG